MNVHFGCPATRLAFASCAIMLGSCTDAKNEASLDRRDSIGVVLTAADVTDTVPFHLYRAPAAFPLGFSTYLPVGMRARLSSDGAGAGVTFEFLVADAGPARPFLHLFVYPEGTTEALARRLVEAYAASRGVPISEAETAVAPWSEEGVPPESGTVAAEALTGLLLEIPYTYNCAVGADCALGRIALGEQDQRFFHLVIQYPPSTASAFLPIVRAVLHRWRWQR